jgi:WD40 repeat protein
VYGAVPGPDGKTLAWYARATLQLQDVASGTMQARLSYQDFITGFTFSPDGKWLLVSVGGGLLQAVQIDLPGGVHATDLAMLQDARITAPVFSPDGKLAAAGIDNTVSVWETTNWTQVAKLKQDESFLHLVAFSPDGKVLIGLDEAELLTVWRVP